MQENKVKYKAVHVFLFVPIFVVMVGSLLMSCSGIQPRYHSVSHGETLGYIAKRYEVAVADLEKANPSIKSQGLKSGSRLYIPYEARQDWNVADVAALEREVASNSNPPSNDGDVSRPMFSWPVVGDVSSPYGRRKFRGVTRDHEGVDIIAYRGTPVKASRSGHVIYATNRISGYGNMVIIKHGDEYSTIYAHLSKFKVKKGQFVSRGQVIGLVGRTGRASGTHLHFEVRQNRKPVDPLLYLQGPFVANILGR